MFMAVPCLRRSVASLSPRSLVFDYRSVHVEFMMDKVALAQSFLTVLLFPPVTIIPPMVHTGLHLNTTVLSLGTFQKAVLLRQSGSIGSESTFTFLSVKG